MKKYNITIVILQLAFFSSFVNIFVLTYSQSSSNIVMEPKHSGDAEYDPKDSSLLMSVDPFVIDGNLGWISAANESWVTVEDGVYIIENLSIQGADQVSCIVIKNSNVPFMIRNCTLFTAYNVSSSYVGFGGLELYNVANGQIVGNTILNNHNHGIVLGNSVNITVTKNELIGNKNWAIITFAFCDRITIFNNIFDHNDNGIQLSPHGNFNSIYFNLINRSRTGIEIRGNYTHVFKNIIRNTHYGISIKSGDNNIIEENIINGTGAYYIVRGISLEGAHNNRINNNYISSVGLGDFGFFLTQSTENLIFNNIIEMTYAAILITYESNRNIFYNNTTDRQYYSREGLILEMSHNNLIYYNEFVSHYCGLSMYESNCNSIWFNNISYNVEYGIFSEDCNYNLISNNTINHNGIGISLDSGLNNSIIGNNISQNEGDGIFLVESYNHTISFNTLVGNQKGVVESNCEGNIILNNTIENRVVPLKKNIIPSYNSLIVIGSFMSIVIIICYRIAWKK